MREALEQLTQEALWLLAAMNESDKTKYPKAIQSLREAIRRAQISLVDQK